MDMVDVKGDTAQENAQYPVNSERMDENKVFVGMAS
jgi:hypothetical protein